ncbi:TetR/AcrR family transcriptional regulator [Streptomyces zhihengii]|uniref:TetR/AcrR family transcriptional regulator n=1 Tax=Streptomyces zhihengii TaxID=1818004 RepID=A0ABS2UM87_9ACTN|nr:TetR/AcrR family transcriptional regulator [Streptomyces zhihengii]MBM9618458.1 TetR/AcrR family transcriptional regulator [Streptomyces zhihengii]
MLPKDVKRTRAQLTRQRILDAAMQLFSDHGYVATTIESIARHAGVAVQTVYFAFGNKQRLLGHLVDLHLPCTEGPEGLTSFTRVAEALAVRDPRQQMRHLAQLMSTVNAQAAPLLEVLRNAAVTYGDGMEEWQVNRSRRRTLHGHFVDSLAERRVLREGLGHERALDICGALLGPELYHLLATERNWTREQWEDWAYDSLCCHLIGDA